MADNGEVMDKKEKKELNIEIMKNELGAVETIKIKKIVDGPINTNVCRCEIETF